MKLLAVLTHLVISNVSKFDGHLWKCLHITIWTSVLMLLSFQFLPPSLLFLFFPFDVLRCHNTSITSRMVFLQWWSYALILLYVKVSIMKQFFKREDILQ